MIRMGYGGGRRLQVVCDLFSGVFRVQPGCENGNSRIRFD